MRLCSIASGSSGNCIYVGTDTTHILVDVGISGKKTEVGLNSLGICCRDLDGIFITHEHSDHISGLNTLKKQLDFQLCTTERTGRQLRYRMTGLEDRLHTFQPGESIIVGSLCIESFPTLHDCVSPVGYAVTDGKGTKMALATDLGVVTEAVERGIAGAQLTITEANYDPDMLRSGPYPGFLKERILGDHGHLSNEMGGALALHAVKHGARRVILGHLSQENNTPRMAYTAVERALTSGGVRIGADAELSVAPRCECGGWITV